MIKHLLSVLVIAGLCAACGTAPEPKMSPPGDGVTATESAVSWTGVATYLGGLIDCGSATWATNQPIIQQAESSPAPYHFATSFWSTDFTEWRENSAHAEFNQMAVFCTATPGGSITPVKLYSAGDGGWYSSSSMACSVYSHGPSLPITWTFDSNVTVSVAEAVYYPNSGSNGAWGLILRWNGNGSGTRNLWHSCGFSDGVGGALWYLFY